VERLLKFINKNAYVQCAIFGTPYVESGKLAFFLHLRNAGRIGAVAYVSGMVLTIGKLFISVLTTASAYYFLLKNDDYHYLDDTSLNELHSFAGPVVVIFVISYFVGGMFLDVFDMSILTILHCFVADEEMFDGQARYADGSLKNWIDERGTADAERKIDAAPSREGGTGRNK
jgi:Plasma-membrane choline transporter